MSLPLSKIIEQKKFNKRQKDFINNLVKKEGNFTNKDLAKIWKGATLPSKFKQLLIEPPPILELIQERPQKYKLVFNKEDISQQASLASFSNSQLTKSVKHASSVKNDLNSRVLNLEEKLNVIEQKFDNLISPHKKINLKKFKSQLSNVYEFLNSLHDISGVNYETLRRRICRELEISLDYFDDLIYDLQRSEKRITIQSGRNKKYIYIKQN